MSPLSALCTAVDGLSALPRSLLRCPWKWSRWLDEKYARISTAVLLIIGQNVMTSLEQMYSLVDGDCIYTERTRFSTTHRGFPMRLGKYLLGCHICLPGLTPPAPSADVVFPSGFPESSRGLACIVWGYVDRPSAVIRI